MLDPLAVVKVRGGEAAAQATAATTPRPNVDFVQGPVLAPSRVTSIGGAFAGYAEGVDAMAANAAAVAVRPPYSTTWFDHDLSVGLSFPAALSGDDFDNDGQVDGSYEHFFLLTLGASVQAGPFGAGVLGDFQQFQLRSTAAATAPLKATLGRVHALAGYTLLDGQLSVGGGLRVVTMSVDAATGLAGTNVFWMAGAAPEIGVLLRPDYAPWRIGLTYRAPVSTSLGGLPAGTPPLGFDPPGSIRMPWEIETGFALQAGARPLNPHWIDPREHARSLRRDLDLDRSIRHAAAEAELAAMDNPQARAKRSKELAEHERRTAQSEDEQWARSDELLLADRQARYRNWPRARLTVVGEVLITGPSSNAVSLQSLFAGAAKTSGESVSWSPRIGLEGEPVIDWVQVRIGSYIEPSRIRAGFARQHFTSGFDVRLFEWNLFGLAPHQIWRLTAMMDLAPLYQSFGLSIGAWH